MWDNFFNAGGWGMYAVLAFGFCLLAAVALHALRPEPKLARLGLLFAGLVFCAGVLGTSIGICKSAQYVGGLPPDQQLAVLAEGVAESLHVIALAMIVLLVGGVFGVLGALRGRPSSVAAV
jgi:hypothetical protein